MSIAETELQDTETPERAFLFREFRADLEVGDGRTVDVRIVPYGEVIEHNDGHGPGPRGAIYREEFLPGVFDHQVNAAHRVHANVEHEEGINATVGHGVMLRSGSDGFYGTFRLLETPAGETARQLIAAGALDGISLEAKAVKNVTGRGGLVQRAKAELRQIAFTRFGAYKGAKVLALREEPEQTIDRELLPVEMDPELVKRLQAQGIALPSRYTAHPAEDTPAQADTSQTTPAEDATTSTEESK
jgi:HK97 family phage prohead protease